jgi:hypothetical protein
LIADITEVFLFTPFNRDFELVERRIESGFVQSPNTSLTPTLRTSEPSSYYQLFFGNSDEKKVDGQDEPRLERSSMAR